VKYEHIKNNHKKAIFMKKYYIALLTTMLCIQNMHSMEQQQTTTLMTRDAYEYTRDEYRKILKEQSGNFNTPERFINVTSTSYSSKDGRPFTLYQTVDLLSLKLYNRDLNETQIEDLINQGAKVDYEEPQCLCFNESVIMHHAHNDTEQGIKNMTMLIKHNVNSNKNNAYSTSLAVAMRRNNIPMIKLLLPHENVEITTPLEKQHRSRIITYAFDSKDFELITLLINLNLITPDTATEKFAHHMKPNQNVVDFLTKKGATFSDDAVIKAMNDAFPSDEYIECLMQILTSGIDNPAVLARLHVIKAMIETSINSLEKCSQSYQEQ
jgi:hypothetical protein